MMGGTCPSRLGGLGERRKLHQRGLRQRILEHLRSNLACFATYLSDYSLSDYLFFTMYIKQFFRRANGGFNSQTPLATPLDSNDNDDYNDDDR